MEIQKQERLLDKYAVQWGQLQLELMTVTEENSIETKARERLKLHLPEQQKIIYLKP